MQPNIFNWMKMSKSHRHFSERAYPVSADVARHSRNYPQFVQNVQSLSGLQLDKYTQEWNQWNNEKGKAWGARGGIQENSMSTPGIIQRKGIMSVGAMSIGATTRPPVQEFISKGWISGKLCEAAPKNVSKAGPSEGVPSYSGWTQTPYVETNGTGYVKYSDGADSFWLYIVKSIPCGGSSASVAGMTVTSDFKNKVKHIQSALNEYYLAGSGTALLVVDGAPGPKTCSAAYGFADEFLDSNDSVFGAAFFEGLYLPAEYRYTHGTMCSSWHSYTPPAAIVGPVVPDPDPPYKAGMGIIVGVILLGTAIGAWAFGGKKGKRK